MKYWKQAPTSNPTGFYAVRYDGCSINHKYTRYYVFIKYIEAILWKQNSKHRPLIQHLKRGT